MIQPGLHSLDKEDCSRTELLRDESTVGLRGPMREHDMASISSFASRLQDA